MTCAEFLEQVEAFVLGALEPGEAAACEAHLSATDTHAGCLEAYARCAQALVALADVLPPAASSGRAYERLAEKLGTTVGPSVRRRPTRELLAWGMAAAAGLALMTTNTRLRESDQARGAAVELATRNAMAETARKRCTSELEALRGSLALPAAAVALLEHKATHLVPMAAQPGKEGGAMALVNLEARRAFVITSQLAPRPGHDFQLWVIRGKEAPIAAGFLRPTANGPLIAELDAKALQGAAPDAIAISLEPPGGRPTPTEVLMVGAVKG